MYIYTYIHTCASASDTFIFYYNLVLVDPSTCMTSMIVLLQAADAEYSGAVARVGPHQLVEFAGDKISLNITKNGTSDDANDGIELQNGWSITPLTGLEVSLNCAIV